MPFIKRKCCPVCMDTSQQKVVLRKKYKDIYFARWIATTGEGARKEKGYGIEVDKIIDETYEISECGDCSLVYQSIIPDKELLEIAYEDWYDHSKNLHFNLTRPDLFRRMGAFASEVFSVIKYLDRPVHEISVMDFGMGWSEWCKSARGFGLDPKGVELSSSKIKYAQENGFKVFRLEDIEPESIDYINTEQVFEHLDNPVEYLLSLKRVLKPGGVLKISVPNGTEILQRLKKFDFNTDVGIHWLGPIYPIEHLNCFSAKALKTLGESNEMTTVNIPRFDLHKTRLTMRPKESIWELLRSIKHLGLHQYKTLEKTTCKFFRKV